MLSGILVFTYVLCTFIYCASYVRYEMKAKNHLCGRHLRSFAVRRSDYFGNNLKNFLKNKKIYCVNRIFVV